eukprot:23114-Eustigmatos_ZCMA.PRE.1
MALPVMNIKMWRWHVVSVSFVLPFTLGSCSSEDSGRAFQGWGGRTRGCTRNIVSAAYSP